MIVFSNNPQGGFGNRLFHYNFALQIAHGFDIELLTAFQGDAEYVKLLSSDASNVKWKGIEHYKWDDIKTLSREEVYECFLNTLKSRKKIGLKGAFLGDTFFKYTKITPNSLIIPKYLTGIENTSLNHKNCVVHVRGGDFHTWNPLAIQSLTYYINSINKVVGDNKSEECGLSFQIVTDDPSMPLVKYIRAYLKGESIDETINTSHLAAISFKNDLINLSTCDYLVSSPSTFAIWGAILSNTGVKVIHSKKWVDYCIDNKEDFWMNISNGGNQFYKVWGIVND
jgi:hypothetical protein